MSDVAIPFTAETAGTGRAAQTLPLKVRGLTLRFGGNVALDGIDLDLAPVGCTAIMGYNGAGKSLLLKTLHGLVKPHTGTIDWGGHSLDSARARQSLVFQKPILLRRSVAANLDFVLKARRRDRSRRDALLDRVGLLHKARQPARLLSGGEAQRLALARALATDPDVLLLDEPTANLDPAATLAIEQIVADASADGTRIIFVTHDIGQARRIADEVVFLQSGRVIEHTCAASFFSAPQTQAARDYLGGRLTAEPSKGDPT